MKFVTRMLLMLGGLLMAGSSLFAQTAPSFTLAWDRNPETNIAGYRVHIGTASRQYSSSVSVGNVTNYTAASLTPGTTYYFAVTAVNTEGLESDFSAEVSGTTPSNQPTAPGAPTGFLAGAPTSTSCNLSWIANSEPNVVGYRVHIGTASRQYGSKISIGNVTRYGLTSLSPGITYYLAITAINSEGLESAYSVERVITTPLPPTPPAAPTGFLAAAQNSTSAYLSWVTNPETNVVAYRVHIGTASRQYTSPISAGKVTSYTLTSLTPGTTYYLAVTAINSFGLESAYSTERVVTMPTPATPPSVPTGFLASAQSSTTCNLSWTANSETNIAGYRVHVGTASRQYSSPISVGKVTSYTLSSLTPGTTYYLAVTAINSQGLESGYSSERTVTTPTTSTPPSVPTGFLATAQSSISCNLTWTANSETNIVGYRVHIGTASRQYSSPISVGKVTSYTLNSLTPGATYYIAVTAINALGLESGYSVERVVTMPSPLAPPSAPTGFLAAAPNPTSINLSWSANSETNISGYRVHIGTASRQYISHIPVGKVTNHTVTSLAPGTTYYIAITALNSSGLESGYSIERVVTTPAPPIVPTGLLAGAANSTSVNLSWVANSETNIAGYRVHVGTASRQYGSPISVGKVTSYTVVSLTAGTTYYFAVTAINSSGLESGYSAERIVTTPTPVVPPGAPTGLALVQNSANSYTFSWAANPEPNITGYRVHIGTSSRQYSSVVPIGRVTTYTASNLAENTTYYFAVTAINSDGLASPLSVEKSATTQASEPKPQLFPDFAISADPGFFTMNFITTPGKVFRVEASTDLKDWNPIATSFADSNGYFSYSARRNSNTPIRFFRVTPM